MAAILQFLKLVLPILSLIGQIVKNRFEKKQEIKKLREETLVEAKKAIKSKDVSSLNANIAKLKRLR